jgi:hypothetical protein
MRAHQEQGHLSRPARLIAGGCAAFGFLAVLVVGEYLGYTAASGVLGQNPGPEEWTFAAGLGLVGVGFALVVLSGLARVLHSLGDPVAERPALRADNTITAGVLFMMAGVLAMVGLGVVEAVTSGLPLSGKAVVVLVFAVCALVPLAPAYEFWRRRRERV